MPSCRRATPGRRETGRCGPRRQNAAHPTPAPMAGRKVIVIGYPANRSSATALPRPRRHWRRPANESSTTATASNPPSRQRGPSAGTQDQAIKAGSVTDRNWSRRRAAVQYPRGTPPDPQPPALEARGETRRSPITADSPRETTHRQGCPGRALRVATRAWTTQPARGIAPHCRPRRKTTSPKCVARQPQRANRVNIGNLQ